MAHVVAFPFKARRAKQESDRRGPKPYQTPTYDADTFWGRPKTMGCKRNWKALHELYATCGGLGTLEERLLCISNLPVGHPTPGVRTGPHHGSAVLETSNRPFPTHLAPVF